jgi:putative nucleotidyltransferase with HDIG domain
MLARIVTDKTLAEETDVEYLQYIKEVADNQKVGTLLNALKNHSQTTYMHSIRVAVYICVIKDYIPIDEKELEEYVIGGLLHDIGKIKVPKELLEKRGPLSQLQMQSIKEHPFEGKRIVDEYEFSPIVEDVILLHHERNDRSGYPYCMDGADIPDAAKVVAVCDMYDALISKRSYKESYSHEKAMEVLYQDVNKGKLDEKIVDSLACYLAEENSKNSIENLAKQYA